MDCRDILAVTWNLGESLTYPRKKYVRYAKVIPIMVVDVNFGECDLTGMDLRAYFISPDTNVDPIVIPAVISGGKAEFKLQGNVLQDYGKWQVELVLAGQNEENYGTTSNKIEYQVIETVEGNGGSVQPGTTTQNSIDELITKLEKATQDANEGVVNSNQANDDLKVTVKTATDKEVSLGLVNQESDNKKDALTTEINKVPGEIQKIEDKIGESGTALTALDNKIGEVPGKVTEIEDAGSKAVNDVETEGDEQVQRVQDEGQVYADGIAENKKQLQNCSQMLGTEEHPLVGGFSVKDGMMHKVEVDAPISQGNGTIFDPNGMQGVIDEENGIMQIGEGYENLNKIGYKARVKVAEIDRHIIEIESTTDVGAKYVNIIDELKIIPNADYTISWEVLEGQEHYSKIVFYSDDFINKNSSSSLIGYLSDTTKGIVTQQGTAVLIYLISSTPVGSKIKIRFQITKTYYPVPDIPNTAPSGRLVIDEDWTAQDYSFIVAFDGKAKVNENTYIFAENTGGYYVSSADIVVGEKNFLLVSNGFKKMINSSGEYVLNKYSGVTTQFLDLTVLPLSRDRGCTKIYDFISIKGDLAEQGLRLELEKIKSGKYIIPQKFIGTPHNIPYMPKKADDNGITYTTTKVDQNRDTFLADSYGFYEFIPKSTGIPQYGYVEEVNDVWTIPSFFTNVSGILRVTEEGQIRKVR